MIHMCYTNYQCSDLPSTQITPAFKCSGVWPRSGAHWPLPHIPWPHPNLVAEVKTEGFDLLSKVARLFITFETT